MNRKLTVLCFLFVFPGSATAANNWEIIDGWRREKADERALQAARFFSEGQFIGAVDFYCESLESLRAHAENSDRIVAYRRRLRKARAELNGTASVKLTGTLVGRSDEILGSAEPELENAPVFDPTLLEVIKVPKVEFAGIPLRQAISKIEAWSREIDPNGVGFRVELEDGIGEMKDTEIFLSLTGVPIKEALRYTSSLAQMRYLLEQNHIVLERISSHSSDIPSAEIPVSSDYSDGQYGTAEKLLEEAGIEFRRYGGTAVFLPERGTMFVRTRKAELLAAHEWAELVESVSQTEPALEKARMLVALAEYYRSRNLENAESLRKRQAEDILREIERQNSDSVNAGIEVLKARLERVGAR